MKQTFFSLFTLLILWSFTPVLADSEVKKIDLETALLVEPVPLTPFELQDHNGQVFNLDRLKGSWSFLFFGYTHCPDVCPTELSILAELFLELKQSQPTQQQPKGLFVAVDSARDTPEILKEYLPFFSPDFLGITGTADQNAQFTNQLGAIFIIPPNADPEEGYEVAHSAAFHLVNPQGELVAIFQSPHQVQNLLELFLEIRRKTQNNTLFLSQ